jgi:hypothetical protein
MQRGARNLYLSSDLKPGSHKSSGGHCLYFGNAAAISSRHIAGFGVPELEIQQLWILARVFHFGMQSASIP